MTLDLAALPDADLVGLSLGGRDAAFAAIVRRHRGFLYRLALGNVGDPDEALDLVQETLVSAHQALRRYDPARPLPAWLATIAINKCRDWRRRRLVRRLFTGALPLDDTAASIATDDPAPDVTVIDRQELARLWRAVAQLPTALREPLVLHTIEGMSQAATASVLAISEKAVETRLRRARIKLAAMLDSRLTDEQTAKS